MAALREFKRLSADALAKHIQRDAASAKRTLEALTEAGVAFQVRGGEGFFSRQEIRQALLALQRAPDPGPDAQLPAVVRELLEPLGLTARPPTGTRARERWEALDALADLVDEVVLQFTSRPGVKVKIAIEIQADSAVGFDDGLQRAIKENCNVLRFKNAEFEE